MGSESFFSQRREALFWAKVDQSAGEASCWEWTGATRRGGYGNFKVGRRNISAHRYALLLTEPCDRPQEVMALHKCDNPTCVNPSHLYWGDAHDNTYDKVSRGRHSNFSGKGEDNPRALITEDQCKEIIESIYAGEDDLSIARRYGLLKATVSSIRRGKSWKNVPRPAPPFTLNGPRRRTASDHPTPEDAQ